MTNIEKKNTIFSANTGIIGAGPGGITAAIQLKRCNIPFLLFERNRVGGLLLNANLVENFPGFGQGISGVHLVDRFREHLNNLNIDVIMEEVVRCRKENGPFILTTNNRNIYWVDNLIIASGTIPRKYEVKMNCESDSISKKIFSEVVPLMQKVKKHIAIIGGGDAAFDHALLLSPSNRVTIINRSNTTKCLPLLKQRVLERGQIDYLPDSTITSISLNREGEKETLMLSLSGPAGEREGEEVRSGEREKRQERILSADYLITAIGREPATNYFNELSVGKDRKNNIEGLYFVGDVSRGRKRQATISMGDGMKAAMDIYLKAH